MAERRLATIKRFSLAGLAPGWTDECYIDYFAMSTQDAKRMRQTDLKGKPDAEVIDFMIKVVQDQFFGGRVLVLNDDRQPIIVDAEADDIAALDVEAMGRLFAEMNGQEYDHPKASNQEPPQGGAPEIPGEPGVTPSSTPQP